MTSEGMPTSAAIVLTWFQEASWFWTTVPLEAWYWVAK